MSVAKIRLASHLIEELFGEVLAKVCRYLLENGSSPFPVISAQTKVPRTQCKKALCMLICHGMVLVLPGKKGTTVYAADIDRCLLLARYPRFIYCAKTLYDDTGELIIEQLLHDGQMVMSMVIQKVTERLKKAVEGSKKIEPSMVRIKFIQLVEARFVQRVPDPPTYTPEPEEGALPNAESRKQDDLFKLPPHVDDIGTPRGKRKRDPSDESSPRAKRPKIEGLQDTEYFIDEGILWQVNLERFHQYFRHHEIVSAVTRSNGSHAAEIVRTILRNSETMIDKQAPATAPQSYHDILRALPEHLLLTRETFDQHLKILTESQTRIVQKISEAGGGMYIVDLEKGALAMALSNIESVVQERFGSKSHRIFKLLVLKRYLEHKQIESLVLVPAKETKELLYQMFAEGFVSVQELSKAPDHAPSRTYYPFFVDLVQVCLRIQERSCKALANLIARRKFESKETKRLIDKAQRMEVIAASFRSSGAEESQITEIEEMITPAEQEQLKHYRARVAKLETSEVQLDEMNFTLENFLSFQQRLLIASKSKPKKQTSR